MKLSKKIIVNAGVAAVLTLSGLAGCATDGSTPVDFFPPDDDTRASREISNAQITAGAREDSSLHVVHFDGAKLNSLGTEKLTRLVPDEPNTDVAVYVDVTAGDLANSRRDAVVAYLKNCGIAESNIKAKIGANDETNHPAAEQLARMSKTETTGDSSAATATTGGGGGEKATMSK